MPNIAVVDMQGKSVGSMELSEEIFAIEPNTAAMHLVVRSYLAAQRQGTQSALTRGMVRGGGRKIYRQKGTGNARHHSNRAPQFRHGPSSATATSSSWTRSSWRRPRPSWLPRCSRP